MEHCSLSLGLDQGIVEDEDVSVEADADVDKSVDESEEEDNKSDEAEVVISVYLSSQGAHNTDCSSHTVHDDDPIQSRNVLDVCFMMTMMRGTLVARTRRVAVTQAAILTRYMVSPSLSSL